MSIARFGLAEASIAQGDIGTGGGKKPPPKRTAVAVGDRRVVPEPR